MALEQYEDGGVAKTFLGPPPPSWFTSLTRACEFTTFILVSVWVLKDLGGLAFRAVSTGEKADTSGIFNWHPLLMSLAFPVLMAEAVLAYRAPLGPALDRLAAGLGLDSTAYAISIPVIRSSETNTAAIMFAGHNGNSCMRRCIVLHWSALLAPLLLQSPAIILPGQLFPTSIAPTAGLARQH